MEERKSLMANPWINRFVLGFVAMFVLSFFEAIFHSYFIDWLAAMITLYISLRVLPLKPEEKPSYARISLSRHLKSWFNRYLLTLFLGMFVGQTFFLAIYTSF